MIVNIGYDAADPVACLTGNSYHAHYTAERNAMLRDLRHRFRSVRRMLVTFA